MLIYVVFLFLILTVLFSLSFLPFIFSHPLFSSFTFSFFLCLIFTYHQIFYIHRVFNLFLFFFIYEVLQVLYFGLVDSLIVDKNHTSVLKGVSKWCYKGKTTKNFSHLFRNEDWGPWYHSKFFSVEIHRWLRSMYKIRMKRIETFLK